MTLEAIVLFLILGALCAIAVDVRAIRRILEDTEGEDNGDS